MANNESAELELQLDSDFIGSAFSPQVEVTETADGHEVAITYEDAESGIITKTFDVVDGRDGADGYSPTAQVSQGEGSATITITDKDGTTSATVYDGAQGPQGIQGPQGAQGPQGIQGPQGYSPTVAIESTAQAHTVTITDEDGEHSYTVPTYADEEQARADEWTELKGEAEAATDAANAAAESITRAYLPGTVVGGADGLMDDAQAAQWATRESTGSGVARVDSVQGNAQKLTQLANSLCEGANQRRVALSADGQKTTIGPSTDNATVLKYAEYVLPADHVVLVSGRYEVPANVNAMYGLYSAENESAYTQRTTLGAGATTDVAAIFTTTGAYTKVRFINFATAMVTGAYINIYNLQVFDLTDMYGAGNEPSTVEAFRADYPFAYYPRTTGELVPVRVAGIASNDENGNALDGVEWEAHTLRAVGSVADMLYSDHMDVKVGAVTIAIGEGVTFSASPEPNSVGLYSHTLQYTESAWAASGLSGAMYNTSHWLLNAVSVLGISSDTGASGATTAGFQALDISMRVYLRWPSLLTQEQFETLVSGGSGVIFFALATPTTTPISHELSMTYRVEQGGTENIIVPSGEISAPPVWYVSYAKGAAQVVADALAAIAAPDGPTATASHAVGSYLTMNGKLYKVTSAIAVGETINAGTNITETTVMAELIARTA